MRCCPEVHEYARNQSITLHSLTSYIKSFLPKKIPRIAMFGPGMETSTSGIVRKIIEDKTDLFQVTGMFPGQARGTVMTSNKARLPYVSIWYLAVKQALLEITTPSN